MAQPWDCEGPKFMADNPNQKSEEQSKPIELTQADVDRIMSLPERTFMIGNIATRGLFDEANRRFYLLDEDGNWTRKVAIIKSPVPPSDEEDSEEDNDEVEPDSEEQASEEKEKKKNGLLGLLSKAKSDPDVAEAKASAMAKLSSQVSKRLPITWLHILIAGLILAILMIVVIAPTINQVFRRSNPGLQPPPTSSSSSAAPVESSQQQVDPATEDPTLSNINVIQVKQALIPGDTITAENIQAAGISAADYELLRASGRTLYQWDVANNLIGMVVTKYIPKGGYLASGDESTTYSPSPNPWVNEQQDMTYVTVPLNEKATDPLLNFGSQINLDVVKTITTTQEPDSATGETVTVIKSKEYKYHPATICDILNADGESLYPYYYAYMSIPAAERLDYLKSVLLSNPTLKEKLTPAAVRIKIGTADAQVIGNFNGSDVKLTWDKFSADAVDLTTDAKRSFANSASGVKKTILQAIQENEESRKAAEDAVQSQAQEQLQQDQKEQQSTAPSGTAG